jgi:hypothetical protein
LGQRLKVSGRRWRHREEESTFPKLVGSAIDNLGNVAAKLLETEEAAEARIVEMLVRAASDLCEN